jgi:hypothetical protein
MDKASHHDAEHPDTVAHEVNDGQGDNITLEDVPPDGGYGWICVAACFSINCFTWGAVSVR